ncbi:MAG TPA: hypothetical protein VMU25_01170 [Candidatus Paceibacterota bacterium]|nr:hypothetical protein [Candidatus Paceibacterota bacterium]
MKETEMAIVGVGPGETVSEAYAYIVAETRLQQLLRQLPDINQALDQWQEETFGPSRRSGFFDGKKDADE